MKRLIIMLVVCLSLTALTSTALAIPMHFAFRGQASGMLGSESFDSAVFSLTVWGRETADLTTYGPQHPIMEGLTAVIHLFPRAKRFDGYFIEPVYLYVDHLDRVLGLGNQAQGDLLKVVSPIFASYQPWETLYPMSGLLDYSGFQSIETNIGDLTFTTIQDFSVIANPEPGTALLLGLGLLMFGYLRRRQARS